MRTTPETFRSQTSKSKPCWISLTLNSLCCFVLTSKATQNNHTKNKRNRMSKTLTHNNSNKPLQILPAKRMR